MDQQCGLTSRARSARLLLERLEDRTLLSFTPPDFYRVGSDPWYVEEGDFNQDGLLDLATANRTGRSLSILLGNGDGTFQQAQTYGGVATYPVWVEKGDVNSDGLLDLVMADPGRLLVFLGNGDGTFQDLYGVPVPGGTIEAVEIEDLNGDGFEDVAATQLPPSLVVLLGNGDGTFQEPLRYPVGPRPIALTEGDFNGDRTVDLAVTFASGIAVFLGNGDGTFQNAVNYTFSTGNGLVKSDDFNGDGAADLVAARSTSHALFVLLGNGDGTFQDPMAYPVTRGPYAVYVADFNLDGVLDVVTTHIGLNGEGNTFSVLLGWGDGTFQDPLTFVTGGYPYSVTVEDFNGDGLPDVATANRRGLGLAVLLNDGDWSGRGPGGAPGFLVPALSPARGLPWEGQPTAVATEARFADGYAVRPGEADQRLTMVEAAPVPRFGRGQRRSDWPGEAKTADVLALLFQDWPSS